MEMVYDVLIPGLERTAALPSVQAVQILRLILRVVLPHIQLQLNEMT